MGFDASEVMRELDGQQVMREVDAQRVLRDSSPIASVSNSLLQYKNLARDLGGIDERLMRSIQGSVARRMARSVGPSIAHIMASSVARSVAPSIARSMASDVLRSMAPTIEDLSSAAMIGLHGSIAQAFETHGLDSASIAAWSLRSVQPIRTSALQSILKAATKFGPIVVSPDYEDDAPFEYHPNLEWLLPETATESGGAINEEELWTVVVAYAQGIAVDHRTKVLLSVIGKDGRSFLVQVAGTVVGGLILYWILHH